MATKYTYLIRMLCAVLLWVFPMAHVQAGQVQLEWDPPAFTAKDTPVAEAAGYKLYYWQPHWEVPDSIDVGDQTSFTLTHLETGQLYTFAATAYNIAGDESVYSNRLTVMLPLRDTDGDGLADVVEQSLGTDPDLADTDQDGLSDGDETQVHNTDPLDADSDGDGVNDAAEIAAGTSPHDPTLFPSIPRVESGDVIVDHTWQRVSFQQRFVNPIVVATALSRNGTNPAIVRLRNVNPTGFDIRVQEWDYLDGAHALETVGYIVLERGSYTLPDGTRVEAEQFMTMQTDDFRSVDFVQPFHIVPVVLTAITSMHGADAVTGRVRHVGRRSFEFQMQEQEDNAPSHGTEIITYIAWEPSAGTLKGRAYEVATTPGRITHSWEPLQFTSSFDTSPVFLAATQTMVGPNTATIRWRNKDAVGVEIKLQEERSQDQEMRHAPEVIGYIAFAPIAP